MPELSNLIRQRLGAAKAPATHPDADLISSYAEGGLQPQERTDLTRHLAVCVECRELLALSLPEQVVAPAAAVALKKGRFAGSWLRIAASLAMVLVAVLLIMRRPQHEPAARNQAANSQTAQTVAPSAPPVTNEIAPRTAVKAPQSTASTEERAPSAPARQTARVLATEPQQSARAAEITPSAQTVEIANSSISQDYINNQVLANQLFLADQAKQRPSTQDLPSAPSPAFERAQRNMFLAGGVAANGNFAGIPAASAQQKTQSMSTVSIFRDSGRRFSITATISRVGSELHLKRPMAQITSQNANTYAMFKPAPANSVGAELASAPESSENLKQSPAFTGLAMAARSRPKYAMFLWRIVQGRLLKSADMSNWLEGYPVTEGIDFSVVRSVGPEVWAGGSDAALVHSSDSGATWQRIVLGAAATGSITSIDISSNGKNVQATSSSGQSWASQDGGKTWMMVN